MTGPPLALRLRLFQLCTLVVWMGFMAHAEEVAVVKFFNAPFSLLDLNRTLTQRGVFETWTDACGYHPLVLRDGSTNDDDNDDDTSTASPVPVTVTFTPSPAPTATTDDLIAARLFHFKFIDSSGHVDATVEAPDRTLLFPPSSGYIHGATDPCAKSNASHVCLPSDVNLTRHANLLMRLVNAMGWHHVVALNDNSCTIFTLPVPLRNAILEAADAYNVSLIAHETAYEASCSVLPVDQHPIRLVFADDVYSMALAMVRSITFHADNQRLVYLYPEDINAVSFETLIAAMNPWDTTGEIRAIARARTIIISSKLPDLLTDLPVITAANAFLSYFGTRCTALQDLVVDYQLKDAKNDFMVAMQAPTDKNPERDVLAYRLRALTSDQGNVVFYSLLGAEIDQPILFPTYPELLPASEYPLEIRILLVFQRLSPTLQGGSAGADAMALAAAEYLAEVYPDIRVQLLRADVTGQDCSVIPSLAETHAVHLIAGPVVSDCAIKAMNVARLNPDLQLISPIGSSAVLVNSSVYPNYLSLSASTLKLGANLVNLVSALGQFDCITLIHDVSITPNVETTERFRSLATAAGHSVALELVFPASEDEILVDQLLQALWANGTGLVVVSLYPIQSRVLFERAYALGLLDTNVFWVASRFALPKSDWNLDVRLAMTGRLISMNLNTPTGTSPYAAPFAAFDSSTDHSVFFPQILDRAWVINVAEIVMIAATAAEKMKYTNRFGRNLNVTRRLLREAVASILVNNSIEGLYYDHLSIDAEGELGATETVAFVNGDAVTIGNPEGSVLGSWQPRALSCAPAPLPTRPPTAALNTSVPAADTDDEQTLILAIALPLVVLGLIVLCLILHLQRQRRHRVDVHAAVDYWQAKCPEPLVAPPTLGRNDIALGPLLGGGQYGQVFLGTLRRGRRMGWSKQADQQVVCKQAKSGDSTATSEARLLTEAILLNQLHDNNYVVKLIGIAVAQPSLILVLEYCSQGDLAHMLRTTVEDNRQIAVAEKMRMAQDIARGMASLARYSIVHSDLSARNILVDENHRCKVSDLGLAYVGADLQDVGAVTAVRWAAPEVLDGRIGPQSDVWSFGIVLYEITTDAAALPYGSLSSSAVVVAVKAGYRMPRPVSCPEPVYDIMQQCWCEYRARPSFLHLAAQLSSLNTQKLNNKTIPGLPIPETSDDERVSPVIPSHYSRLEHRKESADNQRGNKHGLNLKGAPKRRNLDEALPTYLTLL